MSYRGTVHTGALCLNILDTKRACHLFPFSNLMSLGHARNDSQVWFAYESRSQEKKVSVTFHLAVKSTQPNNEKTNPYIYVTIHGTPAPLSYSLSTAWPVYLLGQAIYCSVLWHTHKNKHAKWLKMLTFFIQYLVKPLCQSVLSVTLWVWNHVLKHKPKKWPWPEWKALFSFPHNVNVTCTWSIAHILMRLFETLRNMFLLFYSCSCNDYVVKSLVGHTAL